VKSTASDLEVPASAAQKANTPPPSAQAPLPDNRAFSASELDVLQSLAQRRDELDKRDRALTEREALLQAAEKEVDRKLNEMNSLKGDIEKLLGQQSKMEQDRIVSLVRIYENMKPKEAATIFNTLDMDVLLSVVGRMNERKLSPILAAMDPEKARIVTIRLAEQRKLPGAEAAPDAEKAPAATP
jgi:flagellar motility protein MotE (MotC chaperone)